MSTILWSLLERETSIEKRKIRENTLPSCQSLERVLWMDESQCRQQSGSSDGCHSKFHCGMPSPSFWGLISQTRDGRKCKMDLRITVKEICAQKTDGNLIRQKKEKKRSQWSIKARRNNKKETQSTTYHTDIQCWHASPRFWFKKSK